MSDARDIRDAVQNELSNDVDLTDLSDGSRCAAFEAMGDRAPWPVSVCIEAKKGQIDVFLYDGHMDDVTHEQHLIADFHFAHANEEMEEAATASTIATLTKCL